MKFDIKKLISEGELIEYQGQQLSIKPLSVREQSKFAQLQNDGKLQEASEYLFLTALKQANPEWTDEEILSINDREFINLITQAILRVNGLTQKPNFQNSQQPQQTQ